MGSSGFARQGGPWELTAFYSLLKIPCNQEAGVFLNVTKTKTEDHPELEEFAVKIFFFNFCVQNFIPQPCLSLLTLSYPSRRGPLVLAWSLDQESPTSGI